MEHDDDDEPNYGVQRTSHRRRVLEMAKAGGAVLRKYGEERSGMAFARELIEATAAASHELDKDEFFRRVAEYAETDRLVEMAIDVANGLNQPHVSRAVVEGFENMRRCTHESAKECLAVLVAQELHDTSMPTEYFRVSSRIIASTSIDMLATVRDMLEAWLSVWLPEDLAPLLCRVETGAGPLFFARTTTLDRDYIQSSAPSGTIQWYRFSELYLRTDDFRRTLDCLHDAGFGVIPEGHHQERGPQSLHHSSRCFEWNIERVGWAQQFARCLGPMPRELTKIRRGLKFTQS